VQLPGPDDVITALLKDLLGPGIPFSLLMSVQALRAWYDTARDWSARAVDVGERLRVTRQTGGIDATCTVLVLAAQAAWIACNYLVGNALWLLFFPQPDIPEQGIPTLHEALGDLRPNAVSYLCVVASIVGLAAAYRQASAGRAESGLGCLFAAPGALTAVLAALGGCLELFTTHVVGPQYAAPTKESVVYFTFGVALFGILYAVSSYLILASPSQLSFLSRS
jgi:hypothetical protein